MSVSFALAGVHGDVSARPDRFRGLAVQGGLNGIAFVEYEYSCAGDGRQSVLGLQIGTCRVSPGASIRFAGDLPPTEVTDAAFVLRIPGQVGHTAWTGGYTAQFLALTENAVERILEAPFSSLRPAALICDLTLRMTVYHLLAAATHETDADGPADPLFVESVALAIVRASGVSLPNEPWRRSPTLTAEQAQRLRSLVSAEIANPLSLRDMAEAVALSESYLVRAFKGSFGVTPYQYVLRERVALAQSLIRQGELSLTEVADRAGFPDARRMGRTFRQITGRSPTAVGRPKKR